MLFRSMEEKHKVTLARNSRFERMYISQNYQDKSCPVGVHLESDSSRGVIRAKITYEIKNVPDENFTFSNIFQFNCVISKLLNHYHISVKFRLRLEARKNS